MMIGFLWICCFSALLSAQATQGKCRIKGLVVDKESGASVEGVKVRLYSEKAEAFHGETPLTGKDGAWKVLFIRSGIWNLDFEKTGYQTVKIRCNLSAQAGSKTPEILVQMVRARGPQIDENVAGEIEKGQKLVAAKEYDQAIRVFEGLLDRFEDSQGVAIVNMYIGNCHSLREEYGKAVEAYKLALARYPDNRDLIVSIGNAYSNLHQPDEAMKWFARVPLEELTNIDTLYNIGTHFYNSQRFDQAEKYYLRSVRISPDFAPGWYQLGMTYVAMDKKKEAVDSLKKFMELDPESPDCDTAGEIAAAYSGN